MKNVSEMKQTVTVTAKCPKCKQKKDYEMPINFTPYCDKCHFVPMIPFKISTKTIKK